jgi:hypothetical protein
MTPRAHVPAGYRRTELIPFAGPGESDGMNSARQGGLCSVLVPGGEK